MPPAVRDATSLLHVAMISIFQNLVRAPFASSYHQSGTAMVPRKGTCRLPESQGARRSLCPSSSAHPTSVPCTPGDGGSAKWCWKSRDEFFLSDAGVQHLLLQQNSFETYNWKLTESISGTPPGSTGQERGREALLTYHPLPQWGGSKTALLQGGLGQDVLQQDWSIQDEMVALREMI